VKDLIAFRYRVVIAPTVRGPPHSGPFLFTDRPNQSRLLVSRLFSFTARDAPKARGLFHWKPSTMQAPIIRLPELMSTVCLCKGSIYRGIKSGSFPAPIKLTRRAVGWRRIDIERWIADPSNYRAEAA
jgi:prophage regulatory protein